MVSFPVRQHHDDDDDGGGGGLPSSSSSSFFFFSPALPCRFPDISSPSSPFSLNVPSFSSSSFFHSASLSKSTTSSFRSSAPPLFILHNLLFSVDDHPSSSSSSVSVSPLHPSTPAILRHHSFPAGRSPVCAILATYTFVITAHRDHRIRVWRRPTADDDGRFTHFRYRLQGTLPSTIQKLLAAMSGRRSYVATERRRYDRLWMEHVDTISAMAADEDESCVYTGSWDRSVKVWGLKRMACIQSIDRAHDDAVSGVAIVPTAAGGGGGGGLLVTASADGYVKGWMKVGGCRRVMVWAVAAHTGGVAALAVGCRSGGGDVLYTAGNADCSIRVWERQINQKQKGAKSSATSIRRHNYSNYQNNLSSSNSNSSSSRVNDGGGGGGDWRVTAELRGHRRAVLCLAVAGPLLCSGSADMSIRVWMRSSSNIYYDRSSSSSAGGGAGTTTNTSTTGSKIMPSCELLLDDEEEEGRPSRYVCMAVLEGHDAAVRRLCIWPEQLASRRRRRRRCFLCSSAVDGEIRQWSVFFSESSSSPHSHSPHEHLVAAGRSPHLHTQNT